MQKIFDPCYKIDSKGKTRVWYMEQNGDKYRTFDGIKDGTVKASEWRIAEPTNVGRSNERDGVAQATFEVEATYAKKLAKDYHRTLENVSEGAHIFEPMLAEKYKSFAPGWAQPKLDGIRCIVNLAGVWSRKGKPIPSCTHIHEILKPFLLKGFVFDGELYNHEYKEDFNTITSIVRQQKPTAEDLAMAREKIQFWCYDLPSVKEGFGIRTNVLSHTLKELDNPSVVSVPTVYACEESFYDELHGQWLEAGYEGSIWRNPAAQYQHKRTKDLLKRKEFQDEEFEVIEILPGEGNWANAAKKVRCRKSDGTEFKAGIKGSRDRARVLLHEKHKVCTVRFFRLTPDGIPRFGVATKFHGKSREL